MNGRYVGEEDVAEGRLGLLGLIHLVPMLLLRGNEVNYHSECIAYCSQRELVSPCARPGHAPDVLVPSSQVPYKFAVLVGIVCHPSHRRSTNCEDISHHNKEDATLKSEACRTCHMKFLSTVKFHGECPELAVPVLGHLHNLHFQKRKP